MVSKGGDTAFDISSSGLKRRARKGCTSAMALASSVGGRGSRGALARAPRYLVTVQRYCVFCEIIAKRERQRVVVHIVDNGTGIAPEIQQHMFEPFFTTKPVGQGTGLGLDIVRRLVIHNAGDINVESRPGRTDFSVSLPSANGTGGGAKA